MKRALLVGINYAGTANELKGCINDVNNVQSFLAKNGFEEESMVVLTDNAKDERKPTRENILRFLTNGIHQTKAGDQFFFHYSGHGSQIATKDPKESDGKDETLVPCDHEKSGMITDNELRVIINKVPSGAKFFGLIDACHSETSFDLRYIYDPVTREAAKKINKIAITRGKVDILRDKLVTVVEEHKETDGYVVCLSGCKDSQTSADVVLNGKATGALTAAFLNVYTENKGNLGFDSIPKLTRNYIKARNLGDQIPRLSFGRADFDIRDRLF